ncbi:hypothetical protein F5Y14DRAFT_442013 [Nemania sp. NC0429]|nr:hypothetical protein F5Y14DRAFT_442013 [Nemania sp. NC0429]
MTHVGGHCVLSKDPFKCACGKQFTRLHTLQRHIQATRKHVLPEYPCSKCTAYQGRRGFKRKDHLVQHLRAFHKYDNDRLAAFSAPHKHQRLNIPVCHIKSCEYYRDPKFRELPIGQQEDNRPFDKQSEYTAHMKNEHNWSPYPCKVPGCGKYDGKGFFNPTALENHCQNNHPESAMAALIAQKDFVKHVTCEYCTKSLTPASLKGHQLYSFACTYCQERMEYRQLMKHKSETCKGGVACSQCQERMEYKQLSRHKSETCKGEVACPYYTNGAAKGKLPVLTVRSA